MHRCAEMLGQSVDAECKHVYLLLRVRRNAVRSDRPVDSSIGLVNQIVDKEIPGAVCPEAPCAIMSIMVAIVNIFPFILCG